MDDQIVNMQNLEGNTALHYAAGNKQIETMLESYGANPSIRNMYGLLPSSGCAPKSFAAIQAILLEQCHLSFPLRQWQHYLLW